MTALAVGPPPAITVKEIAMSLVHTPVSYGELIDKITILEIKSERIADEKKLVNVRHELNLLEQTWSESAGASHDIGHERSELKRINEALWEIEDEIRLKEADADFGPRFIELARAVYVTNDERAAVKRRINDMLGSEIVEEKSYADYRQKA